MRTRSPEGKSNDQEISDAGADIVRGIMKRNRESGGIDRAPVARASTDANAAYLAECLLTAGDIRKMLNPGAGSAYARRQQSATSDVPTLFER